MTLDNPFFLAFFFGIFHLFGGLALGRGLRDWRANPEHGTSLITLGLIIGVAPFIFDWFFILREGNTAAGMAGPMVFVVSMLATFFFWTSEHTRKHEKSIITLIAGILTVLVGVSLTPILITQARIHELTWADWVFGPCIAILPFFVGANFIVLSLKALRTKRSFDEVAAEEEERQEKAIAERRKKKK